MEEEQKMKIEYTNDKLKMEISIQDLIELFETSEFNYNGESNLYKIKEHEKMAFVKYIIDYLYDFSSEDSNIVRWAQPLENCWEDMICGDENFLYSKLDE